MDKLIEHLHLAAQHVSGFIYPNEVELHWSILIVVYPYVTGLVAGAFILASLVKVFNVKEVAPTYRLALLTALSFLLIAALPLQAHLGHPERAFEMFLTPQPKSAMAMFTFVYLWYLMLVLLLEIWFDYRAEFISWGQKGSRFKRWFYRACSLFTRDVSPRALEFDKKAVKLITIVGIPSAFLLHGYVGFIFGSIKANPWWNSVLMPVVFLFSAIVSGIALVLLLYMIVTLARGKSLDMKCLGRTADFLLYALIIDFSLEMLDFIHRLYQSEESIHILSELVTNRLFISLIIVQLLVGTIVPMGLLVMVKFSRLNDKLRRIIYFCAGILVQIGIFSTRWNVVIGGQLFSKSFRGLTVYKMELLGMEGLLAAIFFLVLPLGILYGLLKILPPWKCEET